MLLWKSKSGNEKKSESERSYLQRRRHRVCCCRKVKVEMRRKVKLKEATCKEESIADVAVEKLKWK